ncbi:MAG: single-stranded DNA-binding protein [Candidatus Diapherotrites archaeon]|nr:single-stranded DNA-binding protein [Candidatus Diapherotrites archaeon]
MKVESLRPYQKKVNVTVKVLKMNEAREVTSKLDDSKHTVTEALVGDDTATVLLTLWDEDIKKVGLEKTYDIINGFTSLFKKSLRLNVGRYGEIKDAAAAITEVNEEKGLSEEEEVKPKEEAKEAGEAGEGDSEGEDDGGEEF